MLHKDNKMKRKIKKKKKKCSYPIFLTLESKQFLKVKGLKIKPFSF